MRVFLYRMAALALVFVSATVRAGDAIPDNPHAHALQALVGTTIWYAPHPGCLDKVAKKHSKTGPPERFLPEQPTSLVIKDVKFDRIYLYQFEMSSGPEYVGATDANQVLDAINLPPFDASTFYSRCYFPADPAVVESELRQRDPIAFKVYSGYSPEGRQAKIKQMLDSDKSDFEAGKRLMAEMRKPAARLGMSREQVINKTNWGKPLSVNSTTMTDKKTEQWVYGEGSYLYFTNGVLTAIQN
jgi:hypothetical protein